MSKGYESRDLLIKARELFQLFPRLFEHINVKDVLFFRIEKDGKIPMRIIPVCDDPWQQIVPYKYIILVYNEYDYMTVDLQFTLLAKALLSIPRNYEIRTVLKEPEIIMHKEEQEILNWLQDHKFNIT